MLAPYRLINTTSKSSLHSTAIKLWRSPLKPSRKQRIESAPEWYPPATTGGRLGGQPVADHRPPTSIFYDPIAQKLVNHMMKGGNRAVSQKLLDDAFEIIKIKQLAKRHNSKNSDKHIEINPLTIFHQAVENVTPKMGIVSRRLGQRKQPTPVPILESRALSYGVKYIVHAAREKMGDYSKHNNDIPMGLRLAQVILDGYNNQGGAVQKKVALHRRVEQHRDAAKNRWW